MDFLSLVVNPSVSVAMVNKETSFLPTIPLFRRDDVTPSHVAAL